MASAVHEMWMGTFTTRDGSGSSGANAQRGTCAASSGPLGKGRCDTVVWVCVIVCVLCGATRAMRATRARGAST